MATATIALTDGDGIVTGTATVAYDGTGDESVSFSAEECEGLDRDGVATFSADGCDAVERKVFQEGLREEFTDRDFLVADGGTFHTLKVHNYYEFVGSDAGDSVVTIDGVDVAVAAGATVKGYFAEDISDIPTNNLRKIKIIGDVSLTIGINGDANETVEEVELRFSEGFSRSWEKLCWHLHALTTAVVTGSQPTSCYCALQYCYALREVNLSGVDFSACETMQGMFRDDASLETLDVSTWDFRACTTMMRMCYGCSSLTTVVGFCDNDFSACTTTQEMFYGCTSLQTLDFSGNDFSACTTTQYMFYQCTSLQTLDFSGNDFRACTDARYMFYQCSNCDFTGCDFSSVTNAFYMFYGCSDCNFAGCDFSSVTNAQYMFYNCSNCDFSGCDFSSVTNARYMFYNCSGCTFAGCDFSSVTTAGDMFGGGSSTHPVVVSDCDFRSLTSTYMMFYGGSKSQSGIGDTTVVVSGCNFSGATTTSYMFSNIAHVDCHGCDFRSLTTARYMFNETDIFTTLVFTDNEVGSITDATDMCLGAAELLSADFTGCDFSGITVATNMFSGCTVLTTLLFGTWDMSVLTTTTDMFAGSTALTTVEGALSNLRVSLDVGDCPLSRDSAAVPCCSQCRRGGGGAYVDGECCHAVVVVG